MTKNLIYMSLTGLLAGTYVGTAILRVLLYVAVCVTGGKIICPGKTLHPHKIRFQERSHSDGAIRLR